MASSCVLAGLTEAPFAPGPPNPFPWLSVLRSYRRDPFGHLERMAREYGDVVYSRVGHHRTFLVSHPDLIEDVLVRSRAKFGKDPLLLRLRGVLGQGLLTAEGEPWKRHRKLLAPTFTPRRVQQHAGMMVRVAADTAARWRPGEVVDVGAEMARLTLEVLVRTLFGTGAAQDAQRVADAFSTVSAFYEQTLGTVQLPEWVPTPANRGLRRARAELDDVVARIIRAARERHRAGHDDGNLLAHMLAAQGDEGVGLSDAQLRDEVLTLLLAGHETTSLLLTYTWHLLARNPAAEEALAAELDATLGERDPGLADLPRLTFTRQALDESLRLYPPASTMGRQALEDHVLGGHEVPKGSLVFMSQWVVQRDPRFFDAPLAFRPERWTEDLRASLPRFAYFPFGGGHRVCIGEEFALLEARLVLATLARRFRLEALDDRPLEVVPAITMRPKEPLRMRVAARRAPAGAPTLAGARSS